MIRRQETGSRVRQSCRGSHYRVIALLSIFASRLAFWKRRVVRSRRRLKDVDDPVSQTARSSILW